QDRQGGGGAHAPHRDEPDPPLRGGLRAVHPGLRQGDALRLRPEGRHRDLGEPRAGPHPGRGPGRHALHRPAGSLRQAHRRGPGALQGTLRRLRGVTAPHATPHPAPAGPSRPLGEEFMALFGNAHSIDPASAQQEYARLLGHGEQVHAAYLLIRDTILFTDRRLILIDKQGITGKKTEYHSVPYRSITHFSVETAGHFDLDAELKIWISGTPAPIEKTFTKGVDIYEVQAILTQYVAR